MINNTLSLTRNQTHFGTDWAAFLWEALRSKEYIKIGQELLQLNRAMGIRITPDLGNVFRCFRECNFKQLHTVIVGMDPFNGVNPDGSLIADGLAFSARDSEDAPRSLNNIYEALDKTVFNGEYTPRGIWNQKKSFIGHSLEHWAQDGILLLNCALTTVVGRTNEHIPLWAPFIRDVVYEICTRRDSLGVILMGSWAKELTPLIEKNKTHSIFTCEHPAACEYQNRKWEHNNVFKNLTNFHKITNNIEIDW